MGRTGSGVEARDSSIRIDLSVGGQRVRGTLTVAGKPLKPTPANLKYAARVAAEIREKMRHGTYRHADYFPATTQASSSRDTIGQALDTWLATLAGRPESTLRGYRFAVDWWKSKIGGKPLPTLLRSDILTARNVRDVPPAQDMHRLDRIVGARHAHRAPGLRPQTGERALHSRRQRRGFRGHQGSIAPARPARAGPWPSSPVRPSRRP